MADEYTVSVIAMVDRFNDKLIELVRKHPVLYDRNGERVDNATREQAWNKVATVLGRKVSECKTRWRTIRDSYRKNKRKGKGASSKSQYSDGRLKFLDSSLDENTTISNQDSRSGDDEIGDSSSHEEITVLLSEKDPNTSESSGYFRNSWVKQEFSNSDLEERPCKRLKTMTPPSKKVKEMIVDEMVKDRLREERLHLIKDVCCPEEGTENAVQTFFKSMSAIVMTFPPALIAETRLKVCNVVTEMELRYLKSCEPLSALADSHSLTDALSLSEGHCSGQ